MRPSKAILSLDIRRGRDHPRGQAVRQEDRKGQDEEPPDFNLGPKLKVEIKVRRFLYKQGMVKTDKHNPKSTRLLVKGDGDAWVPFELEVLSVG